MSPTRIGDLEPRLRRRALARSAVWVVLSWLVLFGVYFAAPDRVPKDGATVVATALGTLVFLAFLGWQVRRILRAELPQLRAAEAVGVLTAVFVVLFASIYWVMSAVDPAQFTEPLDRVSALYFTVAVATTVGFGDIVAVSPAARGLVTIQMVLDVALLAVLVRLAFTLAKVSLAKGETPDGDTPG
ncbi:MAG: potassium channel family protein [Actinomycetales bacterium]|nr:potassium channel family protein [Actinomycetales bacterium]